MGDIDSGTVRGPLPERRMNARSAAALLDNPGCVRRAVLDRASVDVAKMSAAVGVEVAFGQSPFALGQGNRFEQRVKADGYAELVRVLAELGITLPSPPRTVSVKGGYDNEKRVAETREVLRAIASGDPSAANVIDHGMTRLAVGDVDVYLEQDALAFRHEDRLHICEVKGFPLVDGTAEPAKVGAAARQSAVYLASIQDTLADLDLDPGVVSTEVVLICPRNYTIQPTAEIIDVSRELRALRRQLARRDDLDEQIAGLDLSALAATATPANPDDLDAQRAHAEGLVEVLPYAYAPECLSSCDLGNLCRSQARDAGAPCALGDDAATVLAATPTVGQARALADGGEPDDATVEVAATLRRARLAQQSLTPTTDEAAGADPFGGLGGSGT